MLLKEDDSFHIAHLFQFLIQGEQLALHCSKRQYAISHKAKDKAFFLKQSRQERFHASAFIFGKNIIRTKGVGATIGQSVMSDYKRLINEALNRGDIAESLLGMQVILEGLGDVTLENMNTGISKKRGTFDRIRKVILSQEDEHHDFGIQYFKQYTERNEEIPTYLKNRANDYLSLAHQLLDETQPLFEYFEEDVSFYQQQLSITLPHWVNVTINNQGIIYEK